MDRSRGEVEQFIKNNGMVWTQVFSGQGRDDPFAKDFGVTTLPYYWLNGTTGAASATTFTTTARASHGPPTPKG